MLIVFANSSVNRFQLHVDQFEFRDGGIIRSLFVKLLCLNYSSLPKFNRVDLSERRSLSFLSSGFPGTNASAKCGESFGLTLRFAQIEKFR